MGVVILFLGLQLREVDTFVLNDKATQIVNKRLEKRAAEGAVDPYEATFYDPYFGSAPTGESAQPTKREITPPRWLGFSFLSIGSILVLTCPLIR